jgi:hypothetical protein
MKPDLYTKFVLTVIAAALLWLGVERTTYPPSASALAPQPVVITGVQIPTNSGSVLVSLPVEIHNGPVAVRVVPSDKSK